jgi:hypothetical protein
VGLSDYRIVELSDRIVGLADGWIVGFEEEENIQPGALYDNFVLLPLDQKH